MKKEIMGKTEWNLNFFKTNDFLKLRKETTTQQKKFIKKWKARTDWLSNTKVLKQVLDDYENLERNYINPAEEYYYWLKTKINETDVKVKAKFNQVNDFVLELKNELRFFEMRLAGVNKKQQRIFIKDKSLLEYKHFLERLFAQAQYLLSENEEKILSLKHSSAHASWVKMVSGNLSSSEKNVLDKTGKTEKKSFSEILSLIDNQDKKVRDSAATALNEILRENIKAGEYEFNAILANKKVDDGLRKMNRPDLARHVHDDIDSAVVDAMIKTVADNFSIAKKYYQLKAKLLGVKRLQYHERNLAIGTTEADYSFVEAKAMVEKVLTNLDKEFVSVFHKFSNNGAFDVYPKKGKVSGAFCVVGSISLPTFIMLNHTNKLKDVLTLAHEFGHGLNDELMRSKQNALTFGTTLATAEVASTYFEDFVLKEILKSADDELRLSIVMQKLNSDVSTIFRQAALYLFEQELHANFRKSGYLSAEEIGQLFKKHMADYMGDSVEQSAGSENWWLQWSHIRNFFYVYSYVSGLLISKYFQKQTASDARYINKIKYFLSAGLSQSPQTIFKNMGVDVTNKKFWQDGINEVSDLLKEAEKLAKKLKKI